MKVIILLAAVFAVSISARSIQDKNFFTDIFNVLWGATETQIQNVSLLGAQLLAGLSQTGISGITNLVGKRGLENKDFFTDLGNSLYQSLFPVVDQAFSQMSLTLAQLLAGIAINGVGKREVDAKFIDTLTQALLDVYNQVLFPAINTQIQNVALLGAQLLAGLSMTGIDGLSGLLGRRDDKGFTDFITDLGNSLYQSLFPVVDQAFSQASLSLAQFLAGIAMNGVGKREIDSKFIDTITQSLLDVYNQVLFPAINTQIQNVALLGAQLLAGLSMTGINGISALGK